MTCYYPIAGWQRAAGEPVVFKDDGGGAPVFLPCGKCIGCRLDRSQAHALRCMLEAQLHDANCFITLTYADEHLPIGNTLCVRDLQLFYKRLRRAIAPVRIRHFSCGEYGDTTLRPHYHACIFGYDFIADRRYHSRSKSGHRLYVSDLLSDCWKLGHANIGQLTVESAGYVARYNLKKIYGDMADSHYNGRLPEFLVSSKRPAIGFNWFLKHWNDFAHDDLHINGRRMSTPRYFDKLAARFDIPDYDLDGKKFSRYLAGELRSAELTDDRLHAIAETKMSKQSKFVRSL